MVWTVDLRRSMRRKHEQRDDVIERIELARRHVVGNVEK
jgi:hypothetical protein